MDGARLECFSNSRFWPYLEARDRRENTDLLPRVLASTLTYDETQHFSFPGLFLRLILFCVTRLRLGIKMSFTQTVDTSRIAMYGEQRTVFERQHRRKSRQTIEESNFSTKFSIVEGVKPVIFKWIELMHLLKTESSIFEHVQHTTCQTGPISPSCFRLLRSSRHHRSSCVATNCH